MKWGLIECELIDLTASSLTTPLVSQLASGVMTKSSRQHRTITDSLQRPTVTHLLQVVPLAADDAI